MFFGMPIALFPAIAAGYGGAKVLGLLYAAIAAGSFLFSATSGWTRNVHRHGRAGVVAATLWGFAIIAFGFAPSLMVALLCLVASGAADMMSGIFRNVIWNQTIPDSLRGRLASIELLSFSGGPLLGNFESGVVASLFSVRFSVVSGGVLCVVGCALAVVALPAFWRYDARTWKAA
jgi:MFS family permease